MKYKTLFNTMGMIVTLAAFIAMAAGVTLDVNWLFFTSVGVLFVGILLSSVIPAMIISKWQKMMLEHGVPARAKLINITLTGGRFGDARLDFVTDGDDINTSAYVARGEKSKFVLDTMYSIRYNPSDTEICLVMGAETLSAPIEGEAHSIDNSTEKADSAASAEPNKEQADIMASAEPNQEQTKEE